MKLSKKLMVAVSAIAIGGSMAVTAGAVSAETAHCDANLYPNKVELDGSSASTQTGLAPGTEVCIKSSNETTIVEVDDAGFITNLEITNNQGKAQGISYYAWGDEEPCNPSTDPECNPS